MAIGLTPQPPLGGGPAARSAGRLRLLVAGALAISLHAALLMPSRPTLVGSASTETAPAMVVRLLTREVVVPGAPDVPAETAAVLAPEVSPPGSAPTLAREPAREADPAVAAAPARAAKAVPDVAAPVPTPPAPPGLPPAPDYFSGGRLDPGPRPLEDVDPLYPEEAKQQEGSVVLRLLINEAGTVDNVAVVRAYPAGLFEHSALEAFGKAKFSPGRMLGVAVKSQITIEVMFTPINRGKVSGRSY